MPHLDELGDVRKEASRYTNVLQDRGLPCREFIDPASGRSLFVVEVGTDAVPGARLDRCLLFVTDRAIRRVWHYPGHWRELDDAELVALSWST